MKVMRVGVELLAAPQWTAGRDARGALHPFHDAWAVRLPGSQALQALPPQPGLTAVVLI
jgi:hypothetical protein